MSEYENSQREKEEMEKLLSIWQISERYRATVPTILDDNFKARSISYAAVTSKQRQFGLNVDVPDFLYAALNMLTHDNPGKSIMLFKEILQSIHDKKFPSGIPKGYRILPSDFRQTYGTELPIFSDPAIDKRYEAEWRKQKCERGSLMSSDNQCDYAPFWEGLME